jgi:hypothetical protein
MASRCEETMKEHGRAFQCEPCRQIIVFFRFTDASPYELQYARRSGPEERPPDATKHYAGRGVRVQEFRTIGRYVVPMRNRDAGELIHSKETRDAQERS